MTSPNGLGGYRGIAIFGAPGSGKTTVAKALRKIFPRAVHLEASQAVVYPAMILQDRLPPTAKKLFQAIARTTVHKNSEMPTRQDARDFFSRLKRRYSPSVIAEALVYLHQQRYAASFLMLAGVRGYQNALYLKKNGYFIVYLQTSKHTTIKQLAQRDAVTRVDAEKERVLEERLFLTHRIEQIAQLAFDPMTMKEQEWCEMIKWQVAPVECKCCVNTTQSLSSSMSSRGLCMTCQRYVDNFRPASLEAEKEFLASLIQSGDAKYDAMVGVSGGKDSTATLYEVMRMGFTPLAFSLDTGYYPKHIFPRAKKVARQLGADYAHLNIQGYIRPVDRKSFQRTAELYTERDSEALKEKFKKWYVEGRKHYSIKCTHDLPFVRTCQLCRRIVIRAYYAEAQKRGVRVIILGMNEWAGLSQNSRSKTFVFSAIRKLQPFKDKPPVYIVHLPFLLQRSIKDTHKILRSLGWKIPRGEALIESNANSCLFARAAESKARRLLGFHPDTTRLAREVTVGFITKTQAKRALCKIHASRYSVRQILRRSQLI